MTDSLERVFVEVRFSEDSAAPDEVIEDLRARLRDLEQQFSITKDKPPKIFSDAEIENRFVDLFRAAELFRDKFRDKYGVPIKIDPRLLYVATISAYDDIERYKAYHLEKPYRDRSDAIKRSAFLTKWISKISPFQTEFDMEEVLRDLVAGKTDISVKPALANIFFAIMVAMVHISIDCKRRTWLTADAEFHLAYDLLYRRVNEDALMATFQKLVDLAHQKEIMTHG